MGKANEGGERRRSKYRVKKSNFICEGFQKIAVQLKVRLVKPRSNKDYFFSGRSVGRSNRGEEKVFISTLESPRRANRILTETPLSLQRTKIVVLSTSHSQASFAAASCWQN